MSKPDFDEVIEAILDGKYSWACVLFLYGEGHNPLQYIPYRTYHRLMKSNRNQTSISKPSTHHHTVGKIRDLQYLDALDMAQSRVRGGWCQRFNQTVLSSLKWRKS